jgi:hypothetical protein
VDEYEEECAQCVVQTMSSMDQEYSEAVHHRVQLKSLQVE